VSSVANIKAIKPPLAPWGDRARMAFWVTLGIGGWFGIIDSFTESLDEGVWRWVRLLNAVVWIASTVVWVWAVRVRARTAVPE
jgi:hypothetical protein